MSGGRPVVWSWCGTCRLGSSSKYYLGIVAQNPDGTFDGICAGAAIGAFPRPYSQVSGVSKEEAIAAVQKQCGKKKREYSDDPEFLVGLDSPAETFRPAQTETPKDDFPVLWPMLAPNSAPEARLEEALSSPNWIAERKYDGIRLVGYIHEGGIRWTTRNGSVSDPTRPIDRTDALPHLNLKMPKHLWGTGGQTLGRLPVLALAANERYQGRQTLVP